MSEIKTWREHINERGIGISITDAMEKEISELRAALAEAESKMKSILLMVSDDSFACSFQSMGQYRSALIKAIWGE